MAPIAWGQVGQLHATHAASTGAAFSRGGHRSGGVTPPHFVSNLCSGPGARRPPEPCFGWALSPSAAPWLWGTLTNLFIPGRFPQKYRALCAADTSLASIMTGLDCKKGDRQEVRGAAVRTGPSGVPRVKSGWW